MAKYSLPVGVAKIHESASSPALKAEGFVWSNQKDNMRESETRAREDVSRGGSVEFVVAQILRDIHEGRYVPGQKLTEMELTRKYGVSRGSVREAIRNLESKGLLAVSLHRGARIRIFSRNGARDVLEVYEQLACLAARLAAERLDYTKDANGLKDILNKMEAQLKLGESFATARLRYSFLTEVVTLSDNQELRNLMPRCHVTVLRAQFPNVFDLGFAKADLQHLKLVGDAVLGRDPGGAEQAMRRYTRRFGAAIQQSPDEYFAN